MNYLDDWLVLGQSEHKLCAHRSMLLPHLELFGLRIKSCLSPSRQVAFLGGPLKVDHRCVLAVAPYKAPVSDRCPIGTDLQKECCYDRCLQFRLGSSVQGQPSVRLLVQPRAKATHQLY